MTVEIAEYPRIISPGALLGIADQPQGRGFRSPRNRPGRQQAEKQVAQFLPPSRPQVAGDFRARLQDFAPQGSDLLDVTETLDTHTIGNPVQVVANQIDDGVMLATFLVIPQQPGLGIGQRSVDRSFHRVGADHPVRNADETLGREADQTPRQQQLVTGTAATEDLLESKVRSDRSPLGQVGQKTVPAKQPPANDGEPAKIRLPIGMQNLQAGRNFRLPGEAIRHIGNLSAGKRNLPADERILHEKSLPQFEIDPEKERFSLRGTTIHGFSDKLSFHSDDFYSAKV